MAPVRVSKPAHYTQVYVGKAVASLPAHTSAWRLSLHSLVRLQQLVLGQPIQHMFLQGPGTRDKASSETLL